MLRDKRTTAVIGVAGLALGLTSWAGWHVYRARQLQASLPVRPDVSARPATFVDALRDAELQAQRSTTAAIGIAELGRLYQANGFLDQAEACWEILRRRAPSDGHWTYFLADIARTRGNDEAMARWLKETVRLSPTYATAWLKLAEWEFKNGQIEAAERDYRQRLELAPGDPYARLGLARIDIARNRRQDAIHQLETLVRDQPNFYSANNLLAQMLADAGDAEGAEAQRNLGRAALRSREAPDPWLDELQSRCFDVTRLCLWASVELTSNHGDLGVGLLRRAIRIAPTNPTGYTSLGEVFLRLKQPAKARELFEQAIRLPDATADAYAGLSEAYRDLGQATQAAAAARQGVERLPNDANLETALGNSLRANGELQAATVAYRRAADLAPNVAETHFNLGNALLEQNSIDAAKHSLERAVALKPDYAPALLALGRLAMAAGDLEQGGKYARAVYGSNRQLPEARQLMAWWCLQAGSVAAKQGQSTEAEKLLREGVAADPDLPELHARLGVLYGQEGRLADALASLEKYHELAPNEPMASLFLGQAYLHLGKATEARRFLAEGKKLATEKGETSVAALCSRLLESIAP